MYQQLNCIKNAPEYHRTKALGLRFVLLCRQSIADEIVDGLEHGGGFNVLIDRSSSRSDLYLFGILMGKLRADGPARQAQQAKFGELVLSQGMLFIGCRLGRASPYDGIVGIRLCPSRPSAELTRRTSTIYDWRFCYRVRDTSAFEVVAVDLSHGADNVASN